MCTYSGVNYTICWISFVPSQHCTAQVFRAVHLLKRMVVRVTGSMDTQWIDFGAETQGQSPAIIFRLAV